MRIKILHIITGLNSGGAESLLFNLICSSKTNFHYVVSLKGPGKYGKILEKNGINVYYINFALNFDLFKKFIFLIRLIKNINPDIVQTWLYHADLIGGSASYLANSRNIFWGIHHASLDPKINKNGIIYIAKINSLLSKIIPKKIIACSESTKKVHVESGFSKNKFIIIPNGVDTSIFKKSKKKRINFRKKLNITNNEILLGTVARFNPIKDHITLIKSINLLKNAGIKFKYLLVGENMNNKNKILIELIKKYNLQETMILLEEGDISLVMNSIDLHILSSRSEATPMVILESMACGTPCISTNVGDVKKIINNKNFLVKKENPELLFKAIKNYLELDENAKEKISFAFVKKIKEKYSLNKMTLAYLNTYHKYLNFSGYD